MNTQKPPLGSTLRQGHPLAQGCVGAWLMNEGSGNTVRDLSGHGHHGTIAGSPAPTWSTTQWGAGVYTVNQDLYASGGPYVHCGSGWMTSGNYTVVSLVDLSAEEWYDTTSGQLFWGLGRANAIPSFAVGVTGDGGSDYDRLRLFYAGATQINNSAYRIPIPGQYLVTTRAVSGSSAEVYLGGSLLYRDTSPGNWLDGDAFCISGVLRSGGANVYGTISGSVSLVVVIKRIITDNELLMFDSDPFSMFRPRAKTYFWGQSTGGAPSPSKVPLFMQHYARLRRAG